MFADIFYDVEGNFQWTSITAIVALIVGIVSTCISIYNNKKTLETQREMNKSNFKGNVVSKSRIEWIQEVRMQSVAFFSSFYSLIKYVKVLDIDNYFGEPDHSKRIEKIEKNQKLEDLIKDLKEKGILLILYFGPDSSGNNEFLNYMVSLILDRADGLGKSYDANYIFAQEDTVRSLRDFLRIYLKAEWKRANGEISDAEVQSYLESHKIYNDIACSYESGFESHQENIDHFYMMMKINEHRN
ncbi:hypothetical protein [Priestia flexa]|uniref:hypothetical protein n=1 Tax=Priestia flexa TaxID=86664 RepID=UPI0011A26E9D|nr:hypothetical protein [Priestia flexa]